MKLALRSALLLCLLVAGFVLPGGAGADLRGDWMRKFPWTAADTHRITQLPGEGTHTGIDVTAIDYDMTLGQAIRSMSQGFARTGVDSTECCTTPSCGGLGRWVLVWTADQYGNQHQAKYGHMSSSLSFSNDVVLQGDILGWAGSTGYVQPSCPAYHLHVRYSNWAETDPLSQSPIQGISNFAKGVNYESANSGIGIAWYYGVLIDSIRQKYLDGGAFAEVGWTHNVPRMPWPQGLWVHTYRVWGFEQNFRHDPDPWGRQVEGLYEADWSPGTAYLVDSPFWEAWELGAWVGSAYWSISIPRGDIGSCPGGSAPI